MLACLKHFVGYGDVQAGREYHCVDVSERRMLEFHLPPFKAAVDAGARSVMPAFNEINGFVQVVPVVQEGQTYRFSAYLMNGSGEEALTGKSYGVLTLEWKNFYGQNISRLSSPGRPVLTGGASANIRSPWETGWRPAPTSLGWRYRKMQARTV